MLDIETLKQNSIFAALDDEVLKELAPKFKPRTINRSQVLFSEGDDHDFVYLLVAGKLKMTRNAADGRENVLVVLGPGEIIGELSLFSPKKRIANAISISHSELVALDGKVLYKLMTENQKLNEAFIKSLVLRLQVANDALSDAVFSDVAGRVAKVLVDLTQRFGRPAAEGIHVHHELTQEEVAHLVGSSRETVNKAMAEFASQGWLRLGSRRVLVLDREKLESRALQG